MSNTQYRFIFFLIYFLVGFNDLYSQTTTPFLINDYTDDGQENPSFVKLNNGNIFAFWQSWGQNGSQNMHDIYGSIFDINGNGVTPDFLISNKLEADDTNPKSCILSNGNVLVTWNRAISDSVVLRLYDQNGNPITNEFYLENSANGNTVWLAKGTFCLPLDNGDYLIAYSMGAPKEVHIVHYSSNNEFLNLFNFSVTTSNLDYQIKLTKLNNGNIAIVFRQYDQNDYGVFYRILDLNSGFITNSLQANVYNIDYQEQADIISLSNGNFAIAWISDSDSTFSFCRIFDEMGTPLSGELKGDSEVDFFGEVRLIQNDNDIFSMVYDGSYISDTKLLSKGYYLDGSIARQEYVYFNDFQNWVSSFELVRYDQNYDFLIYEDFDSDGNGIFGVYINSGQTSLENANTQYLHEFVLEQNYPNPFNPNTVITYKLPVASNIELTIYNLIGQKVTTLVNERQSAGIYQIKWDGYNQNGNQMASGVYLYRLITGSFVETRKMVLLR